MKNTITPAILAEMLRGYIECAEWADKPEESRARFPNAQKDIAGAVLAAFCEYAGPLVTAALDNGMPAARFGNRFWLTRCGHGTGFWDDEYLQDVPLPDDCKGHILRDRDNRPFEWQARGDSIGDALSAAAYGTSGAISPFAYPSFLTYRGWYGIEGSAEYAVCRHSPDTWEFWRAWNDAHPMQKGAAS